MGCTSSKAANVVLSDEDVQFLVKNTRYIDFKEFLLAVGVCTGDNIREKLKWTFRLYDINHDGYIDVEEMSKIIKSLYEMLGSNSPYHEQQKKVQFIFQKMDENNDGKISLEEFIEVCTQDTQLAKLLCSGTGMMAPENEEYINQ